LKPLWEKGLIKATTDFKVVEQLDTINICVPTPLGKSKEPDMSVIVKSCESLAQHFHPGILVILESTTYPGTTDELMLPMFEKGGLKVGEDFFMCFSPERVDPGNAKFVDPILAYGNLAGFPTDGKGRSVTGGYVYRGKALPNLVGKYIFADWSKNMGLPQGVLFAASKGSDGKWTLAQLEPESHPGQGIGAYVWAFGEDGDGELYVLTNQTGALGSGTGKIWKLVPAGK